MTRMCGLVQVRSPDMSRQVRKAQREVDLAREVIEDDRKRIQARDSRLNELIAETQEKHRIAHV